MFAIIKSGTQQFKVSEGDHIKVSLISSPEGSKVSFDDIIMAFEDEFNIEIDDEELTDVGTVGQAVNLLHSKL